MNRVANGARRGRGRGARRSALPPRWALMVPVVGPFVDMTESSNRSDRTSTDVFLGIGQVGGAAIFDRRPCDFEPQAHPRHERGPAPYAVPCLECRGPEPDPPTVALRGQSLPPQRFAELGGNPLRPPHPGERHDVEPGPLVGLARREKREQAPVGAARRIRVGALVLRDARDVAAAHVGGDRDRRPLPTPTVNTTKSPLGVSQNAGAEALKPAGRDRLCRRRRRADPRCRRRRRPSCRRARTPDGWRAVPWRPGASAEPSALPT